MFPSFWQTTRKELFSFKSLFFITVASFVYFAVSTLILNYRLLVITFFQNSPLSYKFSLIYSLLTGALTAFSRADQILLLVTALLVGANLLLIIKTLTKLGQQKKKINLSFGGSAILGVVVAGCSSCGFSVISLLGLSASFSFIPFEGITLHLVAIILLVVSAIYSLRTLHFEIACKLP